MAGRLRQIMYAIAAFPGIIHVDRQLMKEIKLLYGKEAAR